MISTLYPHAHLLPNGLFRRAAWLANKADFTRAIACALRLCDSELCAQKADLQDMVYKKNRAVLFPEQPGRPAIWVRCTF